MNHSSLRKLAAATAVICENQGGSVGVFFLMKSVYLSDRQMLIDYGCPITGDYYSSMEKGPVLNSLFDFVRGKSRLTTLQERWNEAFSTLGNTVSPRGEVNTDCLSPVEEDILREKIALIVDLDNRNINIAHWMHDNCPEWEAVPKGKSKPLPLNRVLEYAKKIDPQRAKKIAAEINDAVATRQVSLTAQAPLLAHL